MSKKKLGLYIHIPFCKAKCYYCDFNSYPCMEEYIPAYFSALSKEINLYADRLRDYSFKTVFIGGGTPSSVDSKYIRELMDCCRESLTVCEDAEISMESNPGTLSYEKLAAYRAAGINRLSIGLQAWQDRLLKSIGRVHSKDEFVKNFEQARKVGFENINADLIFGLPGQSIKDWEETLEQMIALKPEHLSCYSLKIEENTVFGNRQESGELIPMEDEADREMYYMAVDKLQQAGLRHYEISNFSREGFQCRHNLVYWKAEPYIGLGAGAHSYFENQRYSNTSKIKEYIRLIQNNEIMQQEIEYIDKDEARYEFIILGLRLTEGISAQEFQVRFGEDIFKLYGRQITGLMERQMLEKQENRIKLTSKGLDFANEVFMEFLETE